LRKKQATNFAKGRCFTCGKYGHYADKCPKPPRKLKKKEINALKIDDSELNSSINGTDLSFRDIKTKESNLSLKKFNLLSDKFIIFNSV
jgi:hypothetical protein